MCHRRDSANLLACIYIGHVERGEVNVALFNILKIADALQVDPSTLVEGLSAKS